MIVPRIGIAWGSVCVYRLDIYSGTTLLRILYMNKPLLYSGCFCRLIILISFNFWSVVRVVFGKINFTALLCREFNLLLRTWLHPSHTTDAYSMWGLMWALKNSFLVSMSTMYLNFDRRKTRLETVLHTLLICESQRSLLSMVIPKRLCSDTWSIFAPFRTRSSGKGDNWCFCLVAIVKDCQRLGLDRIDDHMIIITPIGYLI